jgi:hypothetical protein
MCLGQDGCQNFGIQLIFCAGLQDWTEEKSSVEKGYEQENNSERKREMKGLDKETQINQKRCNWGEETLKKK